MIIISNNQQLAPISYPCTSGTICTKITQVFEHLVAYIMLAQAWKRHNSQPACIRLELSRLSCVLLISRELLDQHRIIL